MPLRDMFRRSSKQAATNEAAPLSDRKQTPPQDARQPIPPAQDPTVAEEATLPAYSKQSQAQVKQPPKYQVLKPDPNDPHGVPYGYSYVHNEQNFPHPSSAQKEVGKPMTYTDPKAAELARRSSQAGRDDLIEMMNYYIRQQQMGKKDVDNSIAAWNGI